MSANRLWDLAWATVRERKGGFVGVLVAVLCSSALLTGLGVLLETGLRGGVTPQRYAAAAVVATGPQAADIPDDLDLPLAERSPLPAGAVATVAALPGVERAVADVTVPVDVVVDGQPAGQRPVRGHGWESASLAPFQLTAGQPPAAPADVVLDTVLAGRTGLAVGDRAELSFGGVPATYRVTGLVSAPRTTRQAAVFFTDRHARELTGRPGQVDAVGVLAAPGADVTTVAGRVESALAADGLAVTVATGIRRGDVEFPDANQARTGLMLLASSFAGTTVMVAVLVMAGTLALSVQQRRREFALLRAVGATPGQIHRLVSSEVLLVSGAGALVGAAAGFPVAFLLRDAFTRAGLLPDGYTLALSPVPVLAAVLLSVGTALLSGRVAARRPARIRPVDALGEATVESPTLHPARAVAGWLCAAGGLSAAVTPLVIPGEAAAAGAGSSALLLVIAAALLGPRLVGGVARVVGPPLRRLAPVTGYLAVANTAASTRRLAAAVTPLTLAVALAAVQVFTQTTLSAAAQRQVDDGVVADYVVTGSGAGIADPVRAAVRDVTGVETVHPLVRSQVIARYTEFGEPAAAGYAAQGVVAAALDRTLDLAPRAGSLADLTGETVALSETAAGTMGVGVGDTVDLTMGDGARMSPTVVAVYGHGLGFGDVTLPHRLLSEHTGTGWHQALLVRLADGADPGRVGRALGQTLDRYPGVTALDRAGLAAAGREQRRSQLWVNLVTLVVLLGYIAIAVVNTLVMTTIERAREFALLRLVGTGRRQVVRMMRLETLIVVGTAVVVGTLLALPALAGFAVSLTDSPVPSLPPSVYGAIAGGTALLGLLATGIPTRVALRTRPAGVVGARP